LQQLVREIAGLTPIKAHRSPSSPLAYFLEKDKREQELASTKSEIKHSCHSNAKINGKMQTKSQLKIDQAEDKKISEYEIQTTSRRKRILSKIECRKESQIEETNGKEMKINHGQILAKLRERKVVRDQISAKNEKILVENKEKMAEYKPRDIPEETSKDEVVQDLINYPELVHSMPSLAFVENISQWEENHPSNLKWWNNTSNVTFEISFHQICVDEIELVKSNLYIRVESDLFTMQYIAENSGLVCMNNYKLAKNVIPSSAKWSINGLTLRIKMTKVKTEFWDRSTPFVNKVGEPLKKNWITINPMKIANEDEEMVKNQELFQDLPSTGPCDDDTEKEDFVASWGDDYISDDNSDNFTDEESDSDELF